MEKKWSFVERPIRAGLEIFLVTLSVALLISYKKGVLFDEFLSHFADVLFIALIEISFIAMMAEPIIKYFEKKEEEDIKKLIEKERKEGRPYRIDKRTMIFTKISDVLEYVEEDVITIDSERKDLVFTIFMDAKTIDDFYIDINGNQKPRICVYLYDEFTDEWRLKLKVPEGGCEKGQNYISCKLMLNEDEIPPRKGKIRLKTIRRYHIDELESFFHRLITEPLERIEVKIDNSILAELLKKESSTSMLDEIKDHIISIENFYGSRANPSFIIRKKTQEEKYLSIDIIPKGSRMRFFILDKIKVKINR